MSDTATKVKETAENLRRIADTIKPMLPQAHGFLLMTFDFDAPGRMNYLSNAQRGDVVKMLREFLTKYEADQGGM